MTTEDTNNTNNTNNQQAPKGRLSEVLAQFDVDHADANKHYHHQIDEL